MLDHVLHNAELMSSNAGLPFILWHSFLGVLLEKCTCYGESRLIFCELVKREAGQTCHWGLDDLVLTNPIKQQIVRDLQHDKNFVGTLLLLKPLDNCRSGVSVCSTAEQNFWASVVNVEKEQMTSQCQPD